VRTILIAMALALGGCAQTVSQTPAGVEMFGVGSVRTPKNSLTKQKPIANNMVSMPR
jgi:hypothetical protein